MELEKYHLGNRKEIYDAELYAIAEALQAAIQRHIETPNERKIRVFTDSTAALKRIQEAGRGAGQWLVSSVKRSGVLGDG
jgi:ribonuclease HI